MEGRDKCEFKINKPLKFLTGRADCISDDPEGRDYVTTKEEVSLLTSNYEFITKFFLHMIQILRINQGHLLMAKTSLILAKIK